MRASRVEEVAVRNHVLRIVRTLFIRDEIVHSAAAVDVVDRHDVGYGYGVLALRERIAVRVFFGDVSAENELNVDVAGRRIAVYGQNRAVFLFPVGNDPAEQFAQIRKGICRIRLAVRDDAVLRVIRFEQNRLSRVDFVESFSENQAGDVAHFVLADLFRTGQSADCNA